MQLRCFVRPFTTAEAETKELTKFWPAWLPNNKVALASPVQTAPSNCHPFSANAGRAAVL